MISIRDNFEHVSVLCSCPCSDVGDVGGVCVCVWETVCYVHTPVRAERLFVFGQRCSLPALQKGHGRGTVILTDAADATSSGATGNSNALLHELLRQQYSGSVLFEIVDPKAVDGAHSAGIGATFDVMIGGSLDSCYKPLPLRALVETLTHENG